MSITSVSSAELYGIVTGKDYGSSHISVEYALKQYPNVKMQRADSFEKTSSPEEKTSVIEGIYRREFIWGKAGVKGFDTKELASHLGEIGKRLDSAHKAGKFTDEEFNELNSSLEEYTEKLASRSERTLAANAAMHENFKPGMQLSPKEYREKVRADTERYLTDKDSEHYCKIDRGLLRAMINRIRYGAFDIFFQK